MARKTPTRTTARKATAKKTATAKAKGNASWTVMVYLAGDNNLDGAGGTDLLEMKKVGSSAAVNVVAQFDRAGGKGSTKRYLLRKGTSLASDQLADLGETNTGDPKVLKDFLAWGIKTYPAQHYLAVLWNHGAGWDDSNLYAAGGDYFSGDAPPVVRKGYALDARGSVATRPSARRKKMAAVPLAQARAAIRRGGRALFRTTVQKMAQSRAIAFDDQAKDYIDNIEMKRVMLDIKKLLKRKIDILGFDACLMSMLEVGYQVKGGVAYTVGSQEEEPNEGWPYDRILTALTKNPAMSPADLSRAAVTQYLASYGANSGVTFAATDLGQVDAVAAAVNTLGGALVKAMTDATAYSAIQTVRNRVQEYSSPYDDYVDLLDLCDGLTQLVDVAEVATACAAVKAAAGQMILQSGWKGANMARSHGSSIYFPKKKVCALYRTLDFAKKNAWAKFINGYIDGLGSRGWG
jgi:cysteine peptidase C11 family protein